MAQAEPDPPRRPGRIRAAWLALMGQRLVPQQVQAEWLLYQQIFDDQLKRLSVYLARQAKAEKERLERLQEHLSPSPAERLPSTQSDLKSELRSRAAQLRGLSGAQSRLQSKLRPNGQQLLHLESESPAAEETA